MSIDVLLKKAHEKHRQKKYEAAAKFYREALEIDPENLDANYLLGTVFAETGKASEAEPYLVKAAELDPSSPYIKINLGNVYKLQGDFEKALEQFRGALSLDDNLMPAHFGIATILAKTADKVEEMVEHVNRALSINPNIPQLHYLIGKVLARDGKNEDAILAFKNVVILNPAFPDINFDIGMCFLKMGRNQDAVAALRKAVKKNPSSVRCRYYLCAAEGKTPDPALQQAFAELQGENVDSGAE
ncbi:lipopolysaccharide assembly protein LapB [Geobacter sp. DSM 9736]|uniref:tetratricopeptide repeat protein n=1 Tax=Geobacter sp. DSM 9736 TaxID=1277350 RepID=UPI000B5FB65F|nr:tetratricopeptide repeat protein [Geobacter sp. DSM 9736]SNB44624.1 Tetratricopeptide repeat-containing protein [Geobacter sp. DSM 9736]